MDNSDKIIVENTLSKQNNVEEYLFMSNWEQRVICDFNYSRYMNLGHHLYSRVFLPINSNID